MKLRSQVFVCRTWILFLACCPQSLSVAQETEEKKIKFPVEMKPFTLSLVDEMGQPVKDAKVTAFGVRCEESPRSWIGWPTDNAGDNEFSSNESGNVEMNYPVRFGAPGLWMTTNKIDFNVRHPDFVTVRVEFDPTTGKAEHTLVQGCRTLFSCIDERGKAIENFGVLMAAGGRSAVWNLASGEMRSSGVPDGSWQTMLVAPRADGVHLFSGVLPARYAKGKDVTIRNAKLRPGMRLSGHLSDNVPRPIVNGKVIAWSLPKPGEEVQNRVNPSVSWWEETKVADDGSFEFPSLPRGGAIQLIAVCNGWLITGTEDNFTVGTLIEVNEQELVDNHFADVTLEMAATGTVEVEVIGPDGKPLVGATVSTGPNQKLHMSGSTVIGRCYRTILVVESQIAGKEPPALMRGDTTSSRYEGKTDSRGKYTVTEIPLKQEESLFVSFDGMRPKPEKDRVLNLDPWAHGIDYQCNSTELKKITVHMEAVSE